MLKKPFLGVPSRLKELDHVLVLQNDLEAVEAALNKVQASIKDPSGTSGQHMHTMLEQLTQMQDQLKHEVETLYSTLNVPHTIPEFANVNITFVQTLFLARDLKMNIRKRAIRSFLEWDRPDQAVGGFGSMSCLALCELHTDQVPGMQLHPQTRSTIPKRIEPALLSAIRKYNNYCKVLEDLRPPDKDIPIPQLLPADLTQLRNNNSKLMEDVWIGPMTDQKMRWLEEPEVSKGIKAMLKQQQCLEERRRLGIEADNLCQWFGEELCAVELALRCPECLLSPSSIMHMSNSSTADTRFEGLLKQKREHVLLLKTRWTNPMTHALRFEEHIKTAERLSQEITGMKVQTSYVQLTTVTMDNTVEDVKDPRCPFSLDGAHPEPQEMVIALADLLAEELEDNDDLLPNGVSSDVQDGNVARTSSVTDVGGIDRNVASAMDGHTRALQLEGTQNTNDSDSDVEIIAYVSLSEQAQVRANKISVEWAEPVVCFFVHFLSILLILDYRPLLAWTMNSIRHLSDLLRRRRQRVRSLVLA